MTDLFSKPRRKLPPVEKVPSPREIVLHRDVAKLLKQYGRADWIWFHPPNEETRGKPESAGVLAGVADWVGIAPGSRCHMLELKRAGGKLSEAQIAFRDKCQVIGVPHAVVFDMAGALAALSSWGALRIKIVNGVPALGEGA